MVNVQDRRPIREFDLKTITTEGHDFLAQNKSFRPLRDELREYANGLGHWGKSSHDVRLFYCSLDLRIDFGER